MENKHGFFKIKRHIGLAVIFFFATAIFSYTPIVVNSMTAGVSNNAWLLSALALAIPIYCIIIGYVTQKK